MTENKTTELYRKILQKQLEGGAYQFDQEAGLLTKEVSQHKGSFYTSLNGVYHIIRESIFYGVGLMYVNPRRYAKTVEKMIRTVCLLQDTDETSETFGVWPLYQEEPLSRQPRPDWNWSDFCGKGLMQFLTGYAEWFSDETLGLLHRAVRSAALRIMKRDVSPAYTNISVMGSYVTLTAGEVLGDEVIRDYSVRRFEKLYQYNTFHECVSEYNSPTYTIEALTDLSLIRSHVKSRKVQQMAEELLDMEWGFTMEHFCPENGQWTGPHSRCYDTIQNQRYLSFLQVGLGERVQIIQPEAMWLEPLWVQSGMRVPERFLGQASAKGQRYFRRHPVLKGELPIDASYYQDGAVSLGSFSFCDFWTQRRPVISYWGEKGNTGYFRMRMLHDDFDFTSGLLQCAQTENIVFGGVSICNDHGDRHFTLDPIQEGRITAERLCLRFEFGGAAKSAEVVMQKEDRIIVRSGGRGGGEEVLTAVWVGRRAFGEHVPICNFEREGDVCWFDVVFYDGGRTELDLNQIEKAYAAFAAGVFRSGEEEEINKMFSRLCEEENTVCLTDGPVCRRVTYPERICAYRESLKVFQTEETIDIIPARHVWRVPSKVGFGES